MSLEGSGGSNYESSDDILQCQMAFLRADNFALKTKLAQAESDLKMLVADDRCYLEDVSKCPMNSKAEHLESCARFWDLCAEQFGVAPEDPNRMTIAQLVRKVHSQAKEIQRLQQELHADLTNNR